MFIDPKDLLLENRFAPITTSMGFFEAECQVVVRHFLEWSEEIKRNLGFFKRISTRIYTRIYTGRLEDILSALLPLKMISRNRFLFIPTANGWTAFFDNGYRGTDPTVIAYLPELMHSRSVWVVAIPHKPVIPTSSRGALILEVYGHEKMEWLNLIRKIRLENDIGRWHFEQFGSPFPFEQTERYQLKKKTDRFDLPLLKQYLNALGGLSVFSEDFYLPSNNGEAVLIEIRSARIAGNKDMTLKEAKRLNGIEQ